MEKTLCNFAIDILETESANDKAHKTRIYATAWFEGNIRNIGLQTPPHRPSRPEKPALLHPFDMPKRGKAGTGRAKIALLHALAHIELNAVDLAWDIMTRFASYAAENYPPDFSMPRDFFNDWMKVADDEAKHFLMLEKRLNSLGAAYGDLPAHDGLWESAEKTAHDFAARLAIVPMVLEARGLDVTPRMIEMMQKDGDTETATLLQIIHDDEITHVRAGTRWFDAWCSYHNLEGEKYWQSLVQQYFAGRLKHPLNHPSREKGGMVRDWYEPLAEDLPPSELPLAKDRP